MCVVSLEDTDIKPESVPYTQCREIRTESTSQTHMDKIIIAASAAICGTVVVAVIVFICCNRRRNSSGVLEKDGALVLGPATTPAPTGPPLASLTALHKDWDQISMYSSRSIPRARMYHMDKG